MKAARTRFRPKITLQVIADHFRVSLQAVQRWEKDVDKISSKRAVPLAQLLEVPVEWLLEGTGPAPGPVKSEIIEIDISRLDPLQQAMLRPLALNRRKQRGAA